MLPSSPRSLAGEGAPTTAEPRRGSGSLLGLRTGPSSPSWLARKASSGALLALLVLWTLVGNALVCAAVVGSRRLRSRVTNLFVVSLAVSDLLVAVLVMPWKAASEVAGHWPFGAAFCGLWVASDILCSTASILNLCVISLDRYWAIASPFRYQRKMTPTVALGMVALAWSLAFLVSFLPVQLNWHKEQRGPASQFPWTASPISPLNATQEDDDDNDNDDDDEAWHCDASLNRTYAISSSLISFYIPVAIMIVTYTRIYRIAQVQIRRISSLERAALHAQNCRRSHLDGGRRLAISPPHHPQHCHSHHPPPSSILRKETKVLKTLSVIMGVFVCCWLPFFVLNCLVPFCQAQGEPCVSKATFDFFVWVGWANSSLNPIIYAFNAEFRKVFAGLLGCPQRPASTSPAETANASHQLLARHQGTLRRHHREMDFGGGGEEEISFHEMPQIFPDREIATSCLL